MILSRHRTDDGPRWALDGRWLPEGLTLSHLLATGSDEMRSLLREGGDPVGSAPMMAPIEAGHEVWASGVTYRRSLVEREAESTVADVYARVYDAERPEIFFKSLGHRVVGPEEKIRIRRDSAWNVPEPELVLVLNHAGEIVGYTAGNDVSSRSIEGENPLYLPQAKCYDGACAIGPFIVLEEEGGSLGEEIADRKITLRITRDGAEAFAGEANTSQMRRGFGELAEYLMREMAFPQGAFLMTGTGIVPGSDFTMLSGDVVHVAVGALTLTNDVA